ncbi:hypothetical protein [Bradyrhizobium sp. CB2312]|uniref:hypothetical protein n=1 Tax=Bradyrhizobium sp. CB2312 TaxID=3039155 RepID=UPI0024B2332D|nr:hypothetical protein [Bradyrhizobium sp. CB2312]WFU72161.1 hypothetical protein QA642_44660 [Bradyrhizobium sp. CB2312]
MTIVFCLLLVSGITGLATGLFFRVWALVLVSPAIAILAAIVLQSSNFGFWTGVPIVVSCLLVGQLAYLAGAFHLHRGELSMQDDANGEPGKYSHRHIGDQNE